jgi:hypothetical protein
MLEQSPVFHAGPSGLRHRRNLMAWQQRGQTPEKALIKENAYSGWQNRLVENCVGGFFQKTDGLFS